MSGGFLLDTHALIWWNLGGDQLAPKARQLLEDPTSQVFASPVSAFEIATKHRLGKLHIAVEVLAQYSSTVAKAGFRELPVLTTHALRAGGLPSDHRDPFDRLLIGQALVEDLTIISNERLFDSFGVSRLWDER